MSFRISHIVIGILLLGIIITGFYTFVGDMAADDAYDVEYEDYSATFSHIDEISDEMNESYSNMQEKWEVNTESSFQIITLVPQALGLVKNVIVLPFSVASGLVTDIITYMKLPAWVTGFVLAIITVFLVFGMVALVLRYRYV